MKFKYWLTSLTDISNAKKKLLHDCSITAEKLFFMPKNELFDILFFTDDDRKIILESRASYDVEGVDIISAEGYRLCNNGG